MNIFNLFKIEKIAYKDDVPIGAVATLNSNNSLVAYDGIVENANKVLKELGNTLADLSNLLYDPHIFSVVQSRKSAVLAMEYEILTDDKEKQEFIYETFSKIDLKGLISEILDAPLFGYKPIELYWDFQEGKVILQNAIGKPPFWFDFDNKGRLKYYSNGAFEFVPNKKFILVQHNATYDNPYGHALLTNCLRPYIYKKGALQLWAEFVQKYGSPFLIGKAETNVNPEQLAKLNELLQDAKRNFTIATSSTFDISTLEVDRNSASALFEGFISFLNSEISKTILSQTLTTEQGKTGSYAMSQTHLQIRQDIVDADKSMVEQALNEIIRLLIDFNYSDGIYPILRLYEETDVDMLVAQRDQILSQIIDFTDTYIKNTYGLSDDDFKMKAVPTPAFAESETPKKLDTLGEFADKVINLALEKIKEGTSLNEIIDEIENLYPGLPTQEVESYLSNAIFLAQGSGIISA
jgi:phage gp29-like protein